MVKLLGKSVSLVDAWVSSHDRISDFYTSSWQRGESPVPMLVLRLMLTALSASILIWSVYESPSIYWLIFLTNWGLVLLFVMNVSGLLVSVLATCDRLPGSDPTVADELPWYVSWYWLQYNLGISMALVITMLYWLLVYNPEKVLEQRAFWLDVATHVGNSLVAVAELAGARTPTRLLHAYQPLALGLWYAVFTAAYYVLGGTDGVGNRFIYAVLDWRSPARAAGVVAAAAVGLLAVWALACGFASAREAVSGMLIRTVKHKLHPNTVSV